MDKLPTTKSASAQPQPPDRDKAAVNWPVFLGSATLIIVFVLWAGFFPSAADHILNNTKDWVARNFGWYYILTAGIVVVFVLIIAFSRVGKIKLGPDHAKPTFSLFTWSAMLFAAGIGIDLMFFGVSGPAANFLTPPDSLPLSEEVARMAPVWTMFHYGIPGWSMYALLGTAFGLFAYRYGMPLSIRSALAPIFGKRINGPVGHGFEIATTVGTTFGIATSLGIGVVFINYGLSALFNTPTSTGAQIALIALAVFVTTLSTVSGVDKGIRRLSELNVVLAIALMVWVLISGRNSFLLDSLVQNLGDVFSQFPTMLLSTFSYTYGMENSAQQWVGDWTLFFWAWWMTWAPFVGLFLARISRGRTLKQFILGVLIIPFFFIILWISLFGNAALVTARQGNSEFLEFSVQAPESAFFLLLSQYPGATFSIGLAVVTGLLFYVTSADSGSLVMANMTSIQTAGDTDGPRWLRIFCAVTTGALTLVMLLLGGVSSLQAATVLMGLPFSFILYLVMISIWRVLQSEKLVSKTRRRGLVGIPTELGQPSAPERLGWQAWLTRKMSFPDAKKADLQLNEVVAPAIEEVSQELQELGLTATLDRGIDAERAVGYVDLVVDFPGAEAFSYKVHPVASNIPNFAANLGVSNDIYFKLEVFDARGSHGQDVMGYTKEQVIADILDAYQAHLDYIGIATKPKN